MRLDLRVALISLLVLVGSAASSADEVDNRAEVASILEAWSYDDILSRIPLVMTQALTSCDCDDGKREALLAKVPKTLDADELFQTVVDDVARRTSPNDVATSATFLESELGQKFTALQQGYRRWSLSPNARPDEMLRRAQALQSDASADPKRYGLYHRVAYAGAETIRRRELLTAFDIVLAGTLLSAQEGKNAVPSMKDVREHFENKLNRSAFIGDPMLIVEMDITYASLSTEELSTLANWLESEAAQTLIHGSHDALLSTMVEESGKFGAWVAAIISERES